MSVINSIRSLRETAKKHGLHDRFETELRSLTARDSLRKRGVSKQDIRADVIQLRNNIERAGKKHGKYDDLQSDLNAAGWGTTRQKRVALIRDQEALTQVNVVFRHPTTGKTISETYTVRQDEIEDIMADPYAYKPEDCESCEEESTAVYEYVDVNILGSPFR